MKRFDYISLPVVALTAVLLTGCIKDSLDACPENDVKVMLRAEIFGNPHPDPASDYEQAFGKRIRSMRYALYSNGTLIWEKQADNLSDVSGPVCELKLGQLDLRDYELVVSANIPSTHYENSASSTSDYAVSYQGPDKTEDYFSAVIPLKVECDCGPVFEGTLHRIQTVVRSILYGVPAEIAAAEVYIDNLSERKYLYADSYDGVTAAALSIPTDTGKRDTITIVTGAFPTAPNGRASSYRLRLFDVSGQPVYDEQVTDTLHLKRNALRDIAVRFPDSPDGEISFEVIMDTRWDGHENGGSTELD